MAPPPAGFPSKAAKKTLDMAASCAALMRARALVTLRRKTPEMKKDIWSNWTSVCHYRTKVGVTHKHRRSSPETVHKGKTREVGVHKHITQHLKTSALSSPDMFVQVLIFFESFPSRRTSCSPPCPSLWVSPICRSTSSTPAAREKSRLDASEEDYRSSACCSVIMSYIFMCYHALELFYT